MFCELCFSKKEKLKPLTTRERNILRKIGRIIILHSFDQQQWLCKPCTKILFLELMLQMENEKQNLLHESKVHCLQDNKEACMAQTQQQDEQYFWENNQNNWCSSSDHNYCKKLEKKNLNETKNISSKSYVLSYAIDSVAVNVNVTASKEYCEEMTTTTAKQFAYPYAIKKVDDNFYICTLCDIVGTQVNPALRTPMYYTSLKLLQKHVKIKHYFYRYSCTDCQARYTVARNLRQHYQNSHDKEAPKKLKIVKLVKHTVKNAGENTKNETKLNYRNQFEKDENVYNCKLCSVDGDSEKFSTENSLNKHIELNHYGYRYQCTECDMKYLDGNKLKKHYKNMHCDIKLPKEFEFSKTSKNECGRTIKKVDNYYVCTLCNKDTSRKYITSSGLKKHIQFKHYDHRYKCIKCDLGFVSPVVLKKHYTQNHLDAECSDASFIEEFVQTSTEFDDDDDDDNDDDFNNAERFEKDQVLPFSSKENKSAKSYTSVVSNSNGSDLIVPVQNSHMEEEFGTKYCSLDDPAKTFDCSQELQQTESTEKIESTGLLPRTGEHASTTTTGAISQINETDKTDDIFIEDDENENALPVIDDEGHGTIAYHDGCLIDRNHANSPVCQKESMNVQKLSNENQFSDNCLLYKTELQAENVIKNDRRERNERLGTISTDQKGNNLEESRTPKSKKHKKKKKKKRNKKSKIDPLNIIDSFYTCAICATGGDSLEYPTILTVQNHIKLQHSSEEIKQSKTIVHHYKREYLEAKMFQKQIDYSAVILKVDDFYQCTLCTESQKYADLNGLRRHIKFCHYGYKYKCTKCDMTFIRPLSIRKHYMNVHNIADAKKFTATLCRNSNDS